MKADLVVSESDLTALAGEWSALYDRCPSATPFQSPEWLLAWWRCFAPGRLWTVTLRDQGRLAGLFPFFTYGNPRRLTLLGAGISDYLDALLEPGAAEAGAIVLRFLADHRAEWDVAEFQELRPGSPLLSLSPPPGSRTIATLSSICPVVKLPGGIGDFHATLSARQRRHLSVALRNIRERHRISFDRAGAENCHIFLEELFRLHASHWNARTLPGVLGSEAIRDFHRRAAARLAEKGVLGLYRLRFDERVAAVIYGLEGQNRYYSYIGGFDPALAGFSPGMIALDFAIAEAIRRGMEHFDFLRGAETYKYSWGAENRYTYCMNVGALER